MNAFKASNDCGMGSSDCGVGSTKYFDAMKTVQGVLLGAIVLGELAVTLLVTSVVSFVLSDRLQSMHALNTSGEPDLSITKAEVLRNVLKYTTLYLGSATVFGVGLTYWLNRALFEEVKGVNERAWAARIAAVCWLIWFAALARAGFDCYSRYGAN